MRTNLSKYTVAFSDLAWESVYPNGNLTRSVSEINGDDETNDDEFVGMFPEAWQVGNYLARYATKFIPFGTIRFNSRVLRIEELDDKAGGWLVSWMEEQKGRGSAEDSQPNDSKLSGCNDGIKENKKVARDRFDKVIVALGFFSKPQIPKIPGLTTEFPGKVLHSSQLDNLNDILGGKPEKLLSQEQRAKVVVIGGSLSGAEVAASLALQLSSAEHSPEASSDLKNFSQYEIVHVTSRRFWALPPFLPVDPVRPQMGKENKTDSEPNPSPTFLPLDLCLYDLSKRLPDPIEEWPAIPTIERSKASNGFFEKLVGGDQCDLGDGSLHIREDDFETPPWAVISGDYSEFVRAGMIKVVNGRVTSAGKNSCGDGTITITSLASKSQPPITVENVIGVITATGFAPYDFQTLLPEKLCKAVRYDPADSFLPLVLGNRGTLHPEFPDIGFIGMYRGPYWGVMEMQARHLAALWAGDERSKTSSMLIHDGLQRMQELRDMKAARPQWPMGDYVGIMESCGREMKMKRQAIDCRVGECNNTVIPARYIPADKSQLLDSDVAKTINSLFSTLNEAYSGRFLARATFRALQGPWRLSRRLISKSPSFPSGTFAGHASFHPRLPTTLGYDAEYLYIEEGTFIVSATLQLHSTRRYVYRYSELDNKLSVWFVKNDDGKSVDYLFHSLEFTAASASMSSEDARGWKARGYHLCSEDHYDAQYEFRFRGISIEKFGIKYLVNGPKKDYIADACYERSRSPNNIGQARL
jgi:hypothetical protein